MPHISLSFCTLPLLIYSPICSPRPLSPSSILLSSLGGFAGEELLISSRMRLRSCILSQGRLLICTPIASEKQEVVLPRGLDITWTSRGKPRATAAHFICVGQEEKAQRKCCPLILWRNMDNQYENGTKRQRLFMLFFLLQLLQRRSMELRHLEVIPLKWELRTQLMEACALTWVPHWLDEPPQGAFNLLAPQFPHEDKGVQWDWCFSTPYPLGAESFSKPKHSPFTPLLVCFHLLLLSLSFCLPNTPCHPTI